METKIASLLNACPSDKAKLRELLEQYMSKSADASNTESEDELEEEDLVRRRVTTTIISSLT